MYSLDKIVDFLITYAPWKHNSYTRDHIKDIIKKHLEYNTIIILRDDTGITAITRWNLYGNTAHVLDCVVREDKRSYGFLRSLMKFALNKFSSISKITWNRSKYPNRKTKEYYGKH